MISDFVGSDITGCGCGDVGAISDLGGPISDIRIHSRKNPGQQSAHDLPARVIEGADESPNGIRVSTRTLATSSPYTFHLKAKSAQCLCAIGKFL